MRNIYPLNRDYGSERINKMQKNNTVSASTNDGQQKVKLINNSRIANIRRKVQGAVSRLERLELELYEIRAILKRGYIEKTDPKNGITQIPLKPFERDTYRNRRVVIEQQIAIANRDYLINNREYKQTLMNNIKANGLKLKKAKEENRIRRNSKMLLNQVFEAINQQAKNGGKEKFDVLKNLAEQDDVKGFRKAFDEFVPEFNKELYTTSSGVIEVKTEIIHGLMDQLAGRSSTPFVTTPEPMNVEVVKQEVK